MNLKKIAALAVLVTAVFCCATTAKAITLEEIQSMLNNLISQLNSLAPYMKAQVSSSTPLTISGVKDIRIGYFANGAPGARCVAYIINDTSNTSPLAYQGESFYPINFGTNTPVYLYITLGANGICKPPSNVAGDYMIITDNNEVKTNIYLPAIPSPQFFNKKLYVATDGSTYYDSALTQLAQSAGDPSQPCTDANWTSTLSPTTCPSSGIQTKTWTKIGACEGGVSHPSTETISCQPVICTVFGYSAWSSCVNNVQTRTVNSAYPAGCSGGNPITSQSCGLCTSFTYSAWSDCNSSGIQTRTVISSLPTGCTNGNPLTTQSCTYIPPCTDNNWTYTFSPTTCPSSGQQTKTWTKVGTCQGGVSHPANETVNCNYQTSTCTSFTYTDWFACSSSGVQTRSIKTASPAGCTGGNPILSQSCTYICNPNWTCTQWSACDANSQQTRTCTDANGCGVNTNKPAERQSCGTNTAYVNVTINGSHGPVTAYGRQYNTLYWQSSGVTECHAQGDWVSSTHPLSGTSGSYGLIYPDVATLTTKTYEVICTGNSQTVNDKVVVNIYPSTVPKIDFSLKSVTPVSGHPNIVTGFASQVYSGDSYTLNWTATNATSCQAKGDWSGSKPVSGSETGTFPSLEKGLRLFQYQLDCYSSNTTINGGLSSAQGMVVELPASYKNISCASQDSNTPCSIRGNLIVDLKAQDLEASINKDFSKDEINVTPGQKFSLRWLIANATGDSSCWAYGDWTGPKKITVIGNGLSGEEITIPTSATIGQKFTYRISCEGPYNGSSEDTLIATVGEAGPSVDLKVNNSEGPLLNLLKDSPATATWTSKNMDTCSIIGSYPGQTVPTSGTQIVDPFNKMTAYGIRCIGAGKTIEDHVTLDYKDCPGACTDWSVCVNSQQSRTCNATVASGCGVTSVNPTETRSCSMNAKPVDLKINNSDGPLVLALNSTATATWTSTGSFVTTSWDWTSHVNRPPSGSETIKVDRGGKFSYYVMRDGNERDNVEVCVPNWECGEWNNCKIGPKTRICWDRSNCNSNVGKPSETAACDYPRPFKNQPASQVIGQPNFTSKISSSGVNGLNIPFDTTIDYDHNLLFVADTLNNRVLAYKLTNGILTDTIADYVLGQPDFTSTTAGIGLSKLSAPISIEYDNVHKRLFVAGSNIVFDRPSYMGGDGIKIFNIDDNITNGMPASMKLNFTGSLAYDNIHDRLFVASGSIVGSVYVYDGSRLENNMDYSRFEHYLGKIGGCGLNCPSARIEDCGCTKPDLMCFPHDITYDNIRDRLFVADDYFGRVLVFNTREISDNMLPSYVLGQSNFYNCYPTSINADVVGICGSESYNDPTCQTPGMSIGGARGLAYDNINNRLYVSDSVNGIDVFNLDNISNGMRGLRMSHREGSSEGGATIDNVAETKGMQYDSAHNRLYVADTEHSRVLVFDMNPVGCTSNWDCTQWSACDANNQQKRTCMDTNYCTNPSTDKPAETQICPASTATALSIKDITNIKVGQLTNPEPAHRCIGFSILSNNNSIMGQYQPGEFIDGGSSDTPVPVYMSVGRGSDSRCSVNYNIVAGDYMIITDNTGKETKVYIPAIWDVQHTSQLKLYIATDGSTYYDSALTQLAQSSTGVSGSPPLSSSGSSSTETCHAFTTALKLGDTNDEVSHLQNVLIKQGLLNIEKPTGYFGALTKAAVTAFQTKYGVSAIGAVGPKTREKLNEVGCK